MSRTAICIVPAITLAAASALPAAGVTIVETFDGDTLATQSLDLVTRDSEGTFTIVNQGPGDDAIELATGSGGAGETMRAQTLDATDFGAFTVSADVSPQSINSTAGRTGVFALGSFTLGNSDGPNTGYQLQVVGEFNSNNFFLRLLDSGVELIKSSVFDLTDGGNATSYNLSLVGTLLPGGDLDLDGTFTPDPADNPNGLSVITLNATIDAANVSAGGNRYGVHHAVFGNNNMAIQYDNITVDVTPIPEPASAGLVLGGLLMLAGRRRL